jgi:hypothetical protein
MGTYTNARRRAGLTGLLAGLLIAGSLVSGLPAAAAVDSTQRPLIDLIKVENGTKDALDGGDYTAITVGKQTFGVLYGSADHPLSAVTLFSVVVRTLGTATVRDADTNRIVAKDVTLPYFTLVAERLDAIFEFRDQNADGLFNYRPNLATRDPFDFNGSEFMVKGAALAGDWNQTGFSLAAVSDDQVNVTMVLTLEGIHYRKAFDGIGVGDDRLNKVEFTIHVAITRETVRGATIPHFEATVDRQGGERRLDSLTPSGTTVKTYNSTRATFKVDHDIVGWDFAPPRLDVQSKLLLHATIIYATGVNRQLAPWLTDTALNGERAPEANVTNEHNSTTVSPDRPMGEVRPATAVGLRDGLGSAGSVGWVPTASVWPEPTSPEPVQERVQFQILGGARFAGIVDQRAFAGFVLSAGFIYPPGSRIYHDPELEAQSVEVEGSSLLPSVLPALILLGEAVVVIGAMAGVLVLVVRATSGSSKAQAADEARRLQALKSRYQLPPPGSPPREGGG